MRFIIEGAKPSPRVANGNLYWYEGDTFSFTLQIDIKDVFGYDKIIQVGETITAVFYNKAEATILTKTFTAVENNTITLSIDEAETAKFPEGRYVLKLFLGENSEQTTVANHIDVIVQ